MVKIGEAVIYVDPRAEQRLAIVTAVWWRRVYGGDRPPQGEIDPSFSPGINAVIVSDDPTREDSYGRQIEHVTSIPHQANQPAHGNYWRRLDDANPLTPVQRGVTDAERALPT